MSVYVCKVSLVAPPFQLRGLSLSFGSFLQLLQARKENVDKKSWSLLIFYDFQRQKWPDSIVLATGDLYRLGGFLKELFLARFRQKFADFRFWSIWLMVLVFKSFFATNLLSLMSPCSSWLLGTGQFHLWLDCCYFSKFTALKITLQAGRRCRTEIRMSIWFLWAAYWWLLKFCQLKPSC